MSHMKGNWRKGKWNVFISEVGADHIPFMVMSAPVYLLMIFLFILSCQPKKENHSQHTESSEAWQCPMKCEGDKTYSQAGTCPVCNMSLEKVESQHGHDHAEMEQDDSIPARDDIYTCPMHSQIQQDKPGSCPICGMDLVKKINAESSENADDDSLGMLLKPTYEYALSSIKTIQPEKKDRNVAIHAPGYLTYDLRKVNSISARFGGRIEKLYIRFAYQPVHKGQHIMDIYSPEMLTAQQDYIFLLGKDSTNAGLIDNARNRLLLLGLTVEQIGMIEKSKKALLAIPVYSPYSGLVFEKTGTTTSASFRDDAVMSPENGSNMNQAAGSTTTESLSVREGMYVEKGQRLFNVQSLETIWAILELYPSDIQSIRTEQSALIEIESIKKPIPGIINYVEPQFGETGKNLRARVYLDNPNQKFKPGTLVKATVNTGNILGLWIPATATIDLGRQTIVFVKSNGFFQSRSIQIGIRSGTWIEVRSGLTEGDQVAENAQFLMDSESFIKSN